MLHFIGYVHYYHVFKPIKPIINTMSNREIKFRAWDGSKMHYDFIVARPQAADVLRIMTHENFASKQYGLPEWKVMQFTGIGNIWEGDILYDEIEEDEGDRRIFYVVTWIKERAAFALLTLDDGEYMEYQTCGISAIERSFEGFYYELHDDIEQLHHKGNIYEHPNLLNK